MRNLVRLSVVALCLAVLTPAGWSQINIQEETHNKDHGNIGAFFNFTRLQDQDLNMLGVGGRIGFTVRKPVMLEAEMAYDFEQTQTQAITVGSLTNTVRTNVRILHALFGPKFQTKGPLHLFVVAKAGLVNFGVGGPATAGAINNQIGTIVNGDTNVAVYPGAGIEFNLWKVSIRAEAGDEIWLLSGGAKSNLRVAIGPQLRF